MTMHTYEYKPKAGMMILVIAVFGAFTAIGIWDASTDHSPVSVDGLILAPGLATPFRWGLAIVCAIFVILGLMALVMSMIGDQCLRLGDETIEMPRSPFGSSTVTVRFADIISLDLMTMQFQRFLRLKTAKRTFTIAESKLTRQTFKTVVRLVAEGRARANKAATSTPRH